MYWYLVLTCETSTLHYSSFWDWKGCVTYFFNFRNSSSSTAETIKTGIYCTSWPIQHLRYTRLSSKARNSYICLWLGIFKCQKLDLTDWSKNVDAVWMKDDIKRKMETLLSTDSKKENYILHIWQWDGAWWKTFSNRQLLSCTSCSKTSTEKACSYQASIHFTLWQAAFQT